MPSLSRTFLETASRLRWDFIPSSPTHVRRFHVSIPISKEEKWKHKKGLPSTGPPRRYNSPDYRDRDRGTPRRKFTPPSPRSRDSRESMFSRRKHVEGSTPINTRSKFSGGNHSSRKLPSQADLSSPKKKTSTRPTISQLASEFDLTSPSRSSNRTLSAKFLSPPLRAGFLRSIRDVLDQDANPTPIQALAMKSMIPLEKLSKGISQEIPERSWGRFLLASETGSGKSFAYMLPVLQHLKETESQAATLKSELPAPRTIVLSPTHELSRQLASFAKSLIHYEKLRVVCASRANNKHSSKPSRVVFDGEAVGSEDVVERQERPIDVLTCTPNRLLELAKGSGWNRGKDEETDGSYENDGAFTVGEPRMNLERVECVVVDEADVLFDKAFFDPTMETLTSIANARSNVQPESPLPFHLILSSATIPASLSTHISTHPLFKVGPSAPHSKSQKTLSEAQGPFTRLLSPNLHRLPSSLRTEHVSWSGGNRGVDIAKKIKDIWAREESVKRMADMDVETSKILIFANRPERVVDLGEQLTEQGIANVTLTSSSTERQKAFGSNRHIDPFLRHSTTKDSSPSKSLDQPRVLVTTSLLSRGIDFDPSVRHVLIVDAPRNMVDFVHRAGRTARAGMEGKVVIFGKRKGRGSAEGDRFMEKLKELTGKV